MMHKTITTTSQVAFPGTLLLQILEIQMEIQFRKASIELLGQVHCQVSYQNQPYVCGFNKYEKLFQLQFGNK